MTQCDSVIVSDVTISLISWEECCPTGTDGELTEGGGTRPWRTLWGWVETLEECCVKETPEGRAGWTWIRYPWILRRVESALSVPEESHDWIHGAGDGKKLVVPKEALRFQT